MRIDEHRPGDLAVPRLLERLAEHEETIRQLRAALAPIAPAFPRAWRLSPRESTILAALVARRSSFVSRYALWLAIAAPGADDQDPRIVDVYLCRVRAKLRALFGLAEPIETLRRGDTAWRLTPAALAELAGALA